MSCKRRFCSCSLICFRALNGREVEPVEVSRMGQRATLKSPPRMVMPVLNSANIVVMFLKNVT